MRPVAIDLFCGLGGWTKGFLAEGYEVIGFDIEHKPSYPGVFINMDVAKLCGYDLRAVNPTVIVASPPCQRYSYMAMPWDRAKREIRWQDWAQTSPFSTGFDLNDLYDHCFRIAREAGCPLIVENVKGAQPWVGRAKWHYGSFYLWGDVPALMPFSGGSRKTLFKYAGSGSWKSVNGDDWRSSNNTVGIKSAAQSPGKRWSARPQNSQWSGTHGLGRKNDGGSWFNQAHNTESGTGQNPVNGVKVAGLNWSNYGKSGYKAEAFNSTAEKRLREGTKQGGEWWHDPESLTRKHSSKSPGRKAASAAIAEIPYDLAEWVARCFKP